MTNDLKLTWDLETETGYLELSREGEKLAITVVPYKFACDKKAKNGFTDIRVNLQPLCSDGSFFEAEIFKVPDLFEISSLCTAIVEELEGMKDSSSSDFAIAQRVFSRLEVCIVNYVPKHSFNLFHRIGDGHLDTRFRQCSSWKYSSRKQRFIVTRGFMNAPTPLVFDWPGDRFDPK